MHEIVRVERQAAHGEYSHVLSMRADFELFVAGLRLAWTRLLQSRVVHQWDYAYLFRRRDMNAVLGFSDRGLANCTRTDHEMCLNAYLPSLHLTPVFVFNLGCLRRGRTLRRGNNSLSAKEERRGADCVESV